MLLKPDIDINRRNFIKLSLVLAGALLLNKITGVLSLASKIAPDTYAVSAPARRALPAGTKEYKNARYGFSLLHPSGLSVGTFDEGGGASTITFQNPEKAEGFQIFIVPYGEPQAGLPAQAGEKRFRQDVPSGVRKSLRKIAVGGTRGDAFYSESATLGATREVWFVRGGFLYELTTLKSLDRWLGTIVKTWKFV